MIRFVLALAFIAVWMPLTAQQAPNGWEVFKSAKFKEQYFKEYSSFVPVPVIDDKLKAWEGKEVQLRGYIIPDVEVVSSFKGIILSKVPYSQCFFCGGAGPESIAEVQLKNPKSKPARWNPDRTYVFKGKLKFNDKDLNHFNFILTEAVLTSE